MKRLYTILILALAATSCIQDPESPMNLPDAPVVSVDETAVTRVSMVVNGTFGKDMTDITQYGVEISETLFDAGGTYKTLVPQEMGADGFSLGVTGLTLNQTYFLRAYISNGHSKLYSPTITQKTPESSVASLSDVTIKDNYYLVATIEDNGGRNLEDVGFLWSTSSERKDIKREKRYVGTLSADGKTFTLPLSEVGEGTHYILAYAEDDKDGTGYSRIPFEYSLKGEDEAQIEDPNFKKYLLLYHDANEDGKFTYAELKQVDFIDVHTDNIKSVREIDQMPLRSLLVNGTQARSGQLTSLNVSKNTALLSIDCSNNNLKELDASMIPDLEYLNCEGNPMETLYLSWYQKFSELRYPQGCRIVYVDKPDEPGVTASKYLTFTSEGTTKISLVNKGNNAPVLYFSSDTKIWTQWDYSELTFSANAPLYICGDNPDGLSSSEDRYSCFSATGDIFFISGDTMSLLNKESDLSVIPSNFCFYMLFADCSLLKSAPSLPATVLTEDCYHYMFLRCTGLISAPMLPATTLAPYCYHQMFWGCTGLTSAPELPATTLAERCYKNMFSSCEKLSYIQCLATDISATDCLTDWVKGVSSTGTFVKSAAMKDWPTGSSGIPEGWTVQNDDGSSEISASKYLTFTSAGSTSITLFNQDDNAPLLYYSYDLQNWIQWDYSELTFTQDSPLYLCGDNPQGIGTSEEKYSNFRYVTLNDSPYYVSGDIMSLINKDEDVSVIPSDYCFFMLFSDNPGLAAAPSLPATTLTKSCYRLMFDHTGLMAAPPLPATTLAEYCYMRMFSRCASLTTAPELPATSLAAHCYERMFFECNALESVQTLPATTLADYCYAEMFMNSNGLTHAPDLPAQTLVEGCYSYMFSGCENLFYVICLATDISATACTENWLYYVASSGTFVKSAAMKDWPTGTSGIPEGWTVVNDGDVPNGGNEGTSEEEWN